MIAGTIAVNNFSMAPTMVGKLSDIVDYLVIRFDQNNGDKNILDECLSNISDHTKDIKVIKDEEKWNRWNWREVMIRALDFVRPDYVLTLDEDEEYGPGFKEDFENFKQSNLPYMLFDYHMATKDGREVIKYPRARHCKAFMWMPSISFTPHYMGYAIPHFPSHILPKPDYHTNRFLAKSKIIHYCFYTKEMEEFKLEHLHK
jgi:hypothetical protein